MVRNITTSRGPRNHKKRVGSYEIFFMALGKTKQKQNKNCFVEDCRQRSCKWSESHFLTSKFLLSKSMVNVIIRNLFLRQSLFRRHAQPTLSPVKEAVSVLSLHEALQPPNTLINEVRVDQPRQPAAHAWV